MHNGSLRWTLTCLLLLGLAGRVAAQSGRATIRGVVTDASGAAVPLVEVTAAEERTGVVTATTSNALGLYSLVNLPVGVYTVSFAKDGFGHVARTGVGIGVLSALSIDVALEIGTFSDVVEVTDAARVESRSAAIGSALGNATVTNLPLTMTSGRSIENFAYAMVPGVEGNNWASNIAGAPSFSKEVLLDGTSATIQIQGHISESSPPMEAVEEFKVETSGMPAEYGRTGGGVFNFSLRSGTNAFRGSAYGQMRNEAFNANTWMNNYLARTNPERAGLYAEPRDRQKLGGTSLGGPIRADTTFYFVALEEYRQTRRQLGAYDRTVPVPAFLDGDFSALLDRSAQLGTDAAGSPIYRGAILDPRTGLVFPGNRIPASRISRVSRGIVELYRQSYRPMISDRVINNSAGPSYLDPSFTQHQFSVKADHSVSSSHRLSGSLIWTRRPRILADQGGVWDPEDETGGPLAKSRTHTVTTHQGRVSHTAVLSPSLLHAGTATFNRFRNPSTTGSSSGDWPNQLGLAVPGAYGSFPQINFGDAINGVDMTDIGYGTSNFYVANVYQYNDSTSWARGRHLVKFGGEVRFIQMNSHGDRSYLEYHFSPVQTGFQGGPLANQVGFAFASFLLGDVARASQHVPSDLYGRRNYGALFVQDDYRLGERITLNVGLRWETTGAWREKYRRWANFNTAGTNPSTGVPGVLEYADQVGDSFEGRRRYDEFGPRIGLAYRISEPLVFRTAYGVFYAPIGANFWSGVPYGFAPGFFGTNMVPQRADGAAAFNWDQAGYPGTLVPPARDPAYTQWGMVTVSPDSLDAGRVQQWNAGVDYELARDVVLGAHYLGNRGTRLQSGDLERNQPDPAAMRALLRAGTEWNWVADAASAAAAGVRYPYPGFAGAAWMAITPFPQAAAGFGPLFFVGSPLGRTDYHALQLTATRRSRGGVTASVSYTLSRQRGNVDSAFQERWTPGAIQDVTRLDQEAMVIGSNDRTHIAKGYIAWSARGWTVSGIFRYESGLPLTIRSSNGYAGWHYPIYANRNGQVPLDAHFDGAAFNPSNPVDPANRYFDPGAFSNPVYGDLGTGPGRFAELRGFGAAYEDLGIVKDFRFGRYTAQVKFDVINVFNRRYFADPETNLGSPYFGQVTGMGWQPPRQGQLGLRLQW